MNFIKDESKAAWKYIWTFVKWLFIAGVTGIVGGLVGTASAFFSLCMSISRFTATAMTSRKTMMNKTALILPFDISDRSFIQCFGEIIINHASKIVHNPAQCTQ